MMNYLFLFFRILIGGTFVLSGVSKLFPIEPFEVIFVEMGITNWVIAPFIARIIIAIEIFMGIAISINLWGKNLIYYLAQASLLAFSAYLVFLLFTKGNTDDCGCFGQLIAFTPLQSLVKNIVLMVMLVIVPKKDWLPKKWLFIIGLLVVSFVATFLLNRVGLQNVPSKSLNIEVDWSGLPQSTYNTNSNVDVASGNNVIVFFSANCQHCKSAAHKLSFLNKEQNIANVYIVIATKKTITLNAFIEETNLNYPILWMTDNTFFKYSGGTLPSIYYVENGIVRKKWTGEFFDVNELKHYFVYH